MYASGNTSSEAPCLAASSIEASAVSIVFVRSSRTGGFEMTAIFVGISHALSLTKIGISLSHLIATILPCFVLSATEWRGARIPGGEKQGETAMMMNDLREIPAPP